MKLQGGFHRGATSTLCGRDFYYIQKRFPTPPARTLSRWLGDPSKGASPPESLGTKEKNYLNLFRVVVGLCSAPRGVFGLCNVARGVAGLCSDARGVAGLCSDARGVAGLCSVARGVAGLCSVARGIAGLFSCLSVVPLSPHHLDLSVHTRKDKS